MLKKCISIANAFIYSIISQFCDTCDREKCKTPVICAREGEQKIHFSIYYYHTFGENDESSKSPLLLSSSSEIISLKSSFPSPIPPSTSTDVLFSHKQRVVFSQTTCCFLPNNVSFLCLRVVINDKIPFRNFLVKKFRRGFHKLSRCSITNNSLKPLNQLICVKIVDSATIRAARVSDLT